MDLGSAGQPSSPMADINQSVVVVSYFQILCKRCLGFRVAFEDYSRIGVFPLIATDVESSIVFWT